MEKTINLIDKTLDKKKRVAIVQSSYIPWKGYFDLINMVDEFILYDDVQFTKNDWRNRNIIKTQKGLQWLTIPVYKKSSTQLIKDTKIADTRWNKKHWKSILTYYARAPYFLTHKEVFEELYLGCTDTYLSHINYRFLTGICEILGIKSKLLWSMDYHLANGKTERLVDLCRQAGASKYLSGPSAKGYIDEKLFELNGIELHYMDYSGYPEYYQMFGLFEHGVSIIDLIFNEGPEAPKYMKSFI